MSTASDRLDPRRRRRGFAIVLSLVLLVGIQWFVFAKPSGAPGQAKPPGQGAPGNQGTPPPFDVGEGSCDVDGVEVFWDAGFFGGTGPATVRSATIAGVAASCATADLTVTLQQGTPGSYRDLQTQVVQDIAPDNGRVPVPFAPYVDASLVTHVVVELAGGTVPIPAECAGMVFANHTIGSDGDDTIEGFQLSNLIYALDGNDTISGGQQDDCIAGQNGNDTLRGGGGKDVLIAGEGDDRLFGDQGNDTLHGGPGVNRLDGGAGVDTCFVDADDVAINCEKRREYGR